MTRTPSSLRAPALAAALALAIGGQAIGQDLFRHDNVSDMRGILNIFEAFANACLEQPVTRDLPAQLLPEGYQIVSLGKHLFGIETQDRSDSAILTKTGSEEADWQGGFPIVHLKMPSEAEPDGGCSVTWKRAWDYPEPLDRLMLDLVSRLEARVSFHMEAILVSNPLDLYEVPQKSGGDVTQWITTCWEDNVCAFTVAAFFRRDDGIDLHMERTAVLGEDEDETP